jgi:LmbE family N-acetylglucosaminyl deacetylase
MQLLSVRPSTVLAVYAHPDDADVAAGGLLARWAREGASVHLVVLCDGSKGSHSPLEDTAALRTTRESEFQRAAAALGCASATNLGYLDGEVSNDVTLRATLVEAIRRLRPEVVLGPDPTAVFFGGVYVNHRDHREGGWALLDAVAPAAAMPLYFPETGEAHQVATLLLSGSHEPDVVADIGADIDAKITAVLLHESQLGAEASAIADAVRSRAKQAGRLGGIDYGEAFRAIELAF